MKKPNFHIPPTRIQSIEHPILRQANISLYIKREDEIHPAISGNKWRKLKYNLLAASEQNKSTLLTFGGAFSNHIYAVAAAGHRFGFKTIGIIRGERVEPLNATLAFAEKMGMELIFVSRTAYRNKEELAGQFATKDAFVIPEGGTNEYAVKGCAEIIEELEEEYDYYCCSAGTGGTAAGIIQGLQEKSKVLVFSALKGDFLQNEIEKLLSYNNSNRYNNWVLNNDYHFGGYAKFKPELIDFIRNFKQITSIPLDPVYTGKLLYGIVDLAVKNHFPKAGLHEQGTKILAIHTGGLQGIKGFEQRFGVKL